MRFCLGVSQRKLPAGLFDGQPLRFLRPTKVRISSSIFHFFLDRKRGRVGRSRLRFSAANPAPVLPNEGSNSSRIGRPKWTATRAINQVWYRAVGAGKLQIVLGWCIKEQARPAAVGQRCRRVARAHWRWSNFSIHDTEIPNCAATTTTVLPCWPQAATTCSRKPRKKAYMSKRCF